MCWPIILCRDPLMRTCKLLHCPWTAFLFHLPNVFCSRARTNDIIPPPPTKSVHSNNVKHCFLKGFNLWQNKFCQRFVLSSNQWDMVRMRKQISHLSYQNSVAEFQSKCINLSISLILEFCFKAFSFRKLRAMKLSNTIWCIKLNCINFHFSPSKLHVVTSFYCNLCQGTRTLGIDMCLIDRFWKRKKHCFYAPTGHLASLRVSHFSLTAIANWSVLRVNSLSKMFELL